MTVEQISVGEWEEFNRCLVLGLRLRSGAQMRNVCVAEMLDLKVEDIVSCLLPQDFAAHITGTVCLGLPDVMELIRDREGLPLFCTLRRLREHGRLPLSAKPMHTRLAEILEDISEYGVFGAEFYRKVALILERATYDIVLRDKLYLPRRNFEVDSLQLAS